MTRETYGARFGRVLPCADAEGHVSCPPEISKLIEPGASDFFVEESTGCATGHNALEWHFEYTASDGTRKGGHARFRCYCEGGKTTQKIKPGLHDSSTYDKDTYENLKRNNPRHCRPCAAAARENLAGV